MKKIKIQLLIILSIGMLFNCSQESNDFNTEEVFINSNKEVLVQSKENDAKVLKLANSISEMLYNGDSEAYLSKFDLDYFLNKITSRLKKGNSFIENFKSAAKKRIEELPKKFINEINDGAMYDFVNYEYNSKDRAYYMLFRFYSEKSGFNYHKYKVSKKGNTFFFNDMYIYLTGEYLSQTMARISLLVGGKNSLQQLFDNSHKNNLEKLIKMQDLMKREEYKKAHQVLSSFEGKMKDEKFVYIMRNQVASKFNESLYKKELQNMFDAFPNDKTIHLHKVDYYLLEGDYGKTLEVLNKLQEETKDDFIEYLKGNVNFSDNKLGAAIENYRYVTEHYEDFFSGHYNYIACLIKSERYEETIFALDKFITLNNDIAGTINYLEERDVNGFNEYEKFTTSKTYKNWKHSILTKK